MIGSRKFWLAVLTVVLAAAVAIVGMALGKEAYVAPILYALGFVAGVFVAGNVGEWVQRRLDPSTIAQQTGK